MGAKSTRTRVVAILVVTIVAALVVWGIRANRQAHKRLQEKLQQYRQEWIDTQLHDLRTGESDLLYFYTTDRTDELLEIFAGMPEVRRVAFELADVSADGMMVVARFPNLTELKLYGGTGVGDEGLALLSGNEKIEKLELINEKVTDEGLKVLDTLPNLRSLTLYREGFRAKTITDQGLLSLKTLKNLEALTVDGGWASEAAVRQLQAELPSCRITTESEW